MVLVILKLVTVFAQLVGRTILWEIHATLSNVLLIVQVTGHATTEHAAVTVDGEAHRATLCTILVIVLATPLTDCTCSVLLFLMVKV